MRHTLPYLTEAEAIAEETNNPSKVFAALRKLSLDDFGLFLISLPNADYPALSKILPRMASENVQKTWTGASGVDLLKQTLAFTRIVENNAIRHLNKPMHGQKILDFGVGYGRILRMMYYFSDPEAIWGVDAWSKSLDTCREAGVLGNLAQSERIPDELPVGDAKFNIAFAFSVFTHLSPPVAKKCLQAIRKHVNHGGLFIPTIRPVEFWPFIDQMRKTSIAATKINEHDLTGIAYHPHAGAEGETYGDTSLTPEFFEGDGWEVLGYDRSVFDPYQISMILRAV